MVRMSRAWLWIAALMVIAGCRSEPGDRVGRSDGGPFTIYAVNYPLAYFAEQIAGERAAVEFPAPADVDPDYWRPDEDVIERFQQADLILLNGSGYGEWTNVVSLPESNAVNTSREFQQQYLTIEDAVVHKHGPEGEHAHEGLATLTWLDPNQARQQALVVFQELQARMPTEHTAEITSRWDDLEAKLAHIDQLVRDLPKPPGGKIYASHPVYGYLGRYCGWDLVSMHWEPDETPPEDEWKKFADVHAEHGGTIMLWEAPPTDDTRTRLESLGVKCVAYYPCGNRPESGDYVTVMEQNIARLRQALEE